MSDAGDEGMEPTADGPEEASAADSRPSDDIPFDTTHERVEDEYGGIGELSVGEVTEALADENHPRHQEVKAYLSTHQAGLEETMARLRERVDGLGRRMTESLADSFKGRLGWHEESMELLTGLQSHRPIRPADNFADMVRDIDFSESPMAKTQEAVEQQVELLRANQDALESVVEQVSLQRAEGAAAARNAADWAEKTAKSQSIWNWAIVIVAALTLVATIVGIVLASW